VSSSLLNRLARDGKRYYRALTAPLRPLPDFLILGAQKAGTTSLHRYLEQHPAVLPPSIKEVHYFDVQWWRGPRWYRSNFPTAMQRRATRRANDGIAITGESSPYYLAHPLVAARVRATLPDVPLVVILRDPIERAHSHYQHNRRMGVEPCETFEAAIACETERIDGELERIRADDRYESFGHRHHSYLLRGTYAAQLRIWFEHFPREQFLILENRELSRDTAGVYRRVLEFLQLPAWQPDDFQRHNTAGGSAPLDAALRARLADWFEPHNRDLYELLDRDFGWTRP